MFLFEIVKILLQITELKFLNFSWKMFVLSFLRAIKNRIHFTDLWLLLIFNSVLELTFWYKLVWAEQLSSRTFYNIFNRLLTHTNHVDFEPDIEKQKKLDAIVFQGLLEGSLSFMLSEASLKSQRLEYSK